MRPIENGENQRKACEIRCKNRFCSEAALDVTVESSRKEERKGKKATWGNSRQTRRSASLWNMPIRPPVLQSLQKVLHSPSPTPSHRLSICERYIYIYIYIEGGR
ncbi:unnamed protein product [Lota lota]